MPCCSSRRRAAHDAKLFEPEDEAPALAKLPMVSLIAIGLLIAIPVIDEVARRLLAVRREWNRCARVWHWRG